MPVTLELPEAVAIEAQAKGVAVETYVQELVQDSLALKKQGWSRFGPGPYTPQEAVKNIRELSKRLTLGGIKIKDLIHQGHKY